MSQAEMIAKLQAVPLFSSCSRRQLKRVAGTGWVQTYGSGQVLCEQGGLADDFFVILEGDADVRRGGRKIGSLGPGDYFGEIALLRTLIERSSRTATVKAVTPMRCFLLGRSEFHKILYEEDIAVKILRAVVPRLDASSAL
jgi:CRP-like cAMP-binding protein